MERSSSRVQCERTVRSPSNSRKPSSYAWVMPSPQACAQYPTSWSWSNRAIRSFCARKYPIGRSVAKGFTGWSSSTSVGLPIMKLPTQNPTRSLNLPPDSSMSASMLSRTMSGVTSLHVCTPSTTEP
jgi:hypothetical protein